MYWIEFNDDWFTYYICSKCGKKGPVKTEDNMKLPNRCPHCKEEFTDGKELKHEE